MMPREPCLTWPLALPIAALRCVRRSVFDSHRHVYHAIAPHILLDAPLIVKIFRIG
jgi:hypothetical protein